MADVRDGELIAVRGIPRSLRAFRHPEGVYLWDEARNHHVCVGDATPDHVAPALINMGHGAIPWVARWYLRWVKRNTKTPHNRPERNTASDPR